MAGKWLQIRWRSIRRGSGRSKVIKVQLRLQRLQQLSVINPTVVAARVKARSPDQDLPDGKNWREQVDAGTRRQWQSFWGSTMVGSFAAPKAKLPRFVALSSLR